MGMVAVEAIVRSTVITKSKTFPCIFMPALRVIHPIEVSFVSI